MDVSALNLATLGLAPDDGAVALPGTPAGDAFAKLLSGIGGTTVAPTVTTATPAVAVTPAVASVAVAPIAELIPAETLVDLPTEGTEAAAPVDPALVVPAAALLRAAAKAAKGAPTEESPQPKAAPEAEAEAAETPTPDSLGLPPLLAALVAPTLSQAAAKPADTPLVTAQITAAAPQAATPAMPLPTGNQPPVAQPVGEAPITLKADATPNPVATTVQEEQPAPAKAEPLPSAAVVAEKQVAVAAAPQPPAAPRPQAATRAPQAAPKIEAASSEPVRLADRPLPMPVTVPVVVAPPVVDLAAMASAPANDISALGAGPPQAAQADLAVERQLDIARDGAWLDQLTRDIVRTASAEGNLRFKLNPENLGSLQVEVTQGQNGASVRLTADTEAARTIIADARPQLIAEARAQGLRIAETHVDLSGQGQQQQAHSQAGQGQNRGRDVPAQEYLTSWKPESAEEDATPKQRSAAERYA